MGDSRVALLFDVTRVSFRPRREWRAGLIKNPKFKLVAMTYKFYMVTHLVGYKPPIDLDLQHSALLSGQ